MGILFTQKTGHLHFCTKVWGFARGLFFVDGHILAQLGIWKVVAAAVATNKGGRFKCCIGNKAEEWTENFLGRKKKFEFNFRGCWSFCYDVVKRFSSQIFSCRERLNNKETNPSGNRLITQSRIAAREGKSSTFVSYKHKIEKKFVLFLRAFCFFLGVVK